MTAPPSGSEHRTEVAGIETPLEKSGCKEERIKDGTGMAHAGAARGTSVASSSPQAPVLPGNGAR